MKDTQFSNYSNIGSLKIKFLSTRISISFVSIRVLIADTMDHKQLALKEACTISKKITVLRTFKRGSELIKSLDKYKPNVIVLGSILKDQSAYTATAKIMEKHLIPVLIISFEGEEQPVMDHSEVLDYGIVETIQVRMVNNKIQFPQVLEIRIHILSKLNVERFRSFIKQINRFKRSEFPRINNKSHTAIKRNDTRLRKPIFHKPKPQITNKSAKSHMGKPNTKQVIVIGASTGGPRMIVHIISQFPKNFPPVLVVQHMPETFTESFAERIDNNTRMRAKLAKQGDILRSGNVYVAQGGFHLELEQKAPDIVEIQITDGAKVNYVKPAVDITLFSAARIVGAGVISVILTGMGHDGREGSRIVKHQGGSVIALNEEDSIIYGMNKSVIDAGIADEICGMDEIVVAISKQLKSSTNSKN